MVEHPGGRESAARRSDQGPDRPWLTCIGPLAVFTVAGLLEGSPAEALAGPLGYPLVYGVRVAATLAMLAAVWPGLRRWVGRPTWWPPLLGVALVVPWVVLAHLQREAGWGGIGRVGYDPFAALGSGWQAWAFLAVRWLGLVAVVPVAEELFLRGFLLRTVIDERFWEVPFGTLTAASAAACAVYAAVTHPGEAVAAVGWFAVVSGIALATRRPIDCILAHAATNLALGMFVFATGNWWLM